MTAPFSFANKLDRCLARLSWQLTFARSLAPPRGSALVIRSLGATCAQRSLLAREFLSAFVFIRQQTSHIFNFHSLPLLYNNKAAGAAASSLPILSLFTATRKSP